MSVSIRWLAPVACTAAGAVMPAVSLAIQYISIDQARMLIFAGADRFDETPLALNPEQVKRIEQLSGVKVSRAEQPVWRVSAAGKFVGWFIIDQVIGKHEPITYALGIHPDGSLKQFQIIEYREAYGSQVRHLNWRDQFVGKNADSTLQLTVDIVNISGATLSCQHVTEGIKRVLALHAVALR